jgi:hypothetical protein
MSSDILRMYHRYQKALMSLFPLEVDGRAPAMDTANPEQMAQVIKGEHERVVQELKDTEASLDLLADLNRGTAEALGKPKEGEGVSWLDIPEWVAKLRDERDQMKKVYDVALRYHKICQRAYEEPNEATLSAENDIRQDFTATCREAVERGGGSR